ncbi:putative indole-3-pyruvate monooxygenase YUCCA9 [Grifola frondosa]|uniref:Putative indole-3-pyruvate monooxygenase YUCCA9 n=1 Tax=Grifola frondosa TaxID=5627 RepID=A0A1C7M4S3_GRIFR|nr:putative indole-3-pyruvate monooxygenase YUCCA9 [Grifola frondosa]
MMATSSRSGLTLPTLDRLHASVPADVPPSDVAANWVRKFSDALAARESSTFNDLSVQGIAGIRSFFDARATPSGLSISQIAQDSFRAPALRSPFPDLSWVQFGFDIQTSAGKGLGYARLVPTESGNWKAYTLFTSLESLNGVVEKAGSSRNPNQEHSWQFQERRTREIEFSDGDPTVLIVGAGHSGLELAANLVAKSLQSLCLHDTVWYDQLPFLSYPSTWPVYTPSSKLGDWLEAYAQSLELNIWTSSNITQARWNKVDEHWQVSVTREDGSQRSLRVKHIVFANGLGGGVPNMPNIPGRDHVGKKVLIVGAGNSAHDIAQDLALHGVDVTMYQRSSTCVVSAKVVAAMAGSLYFEGGPPVDVADRVNAAFPITVVKMVHQRVVPRFAATIDKWPQPFLYEDSTLIAVLIREMLEKLNLLGFSSIWAPKMLGLCSPSFDMAADTMSIRLKTGGDIKEFTPRGVRFGDAQRLKRIHRLRYRVTPHRMIQVTGSDADVEHRFGNPRELAKQVCGAEVGDSLRPGGVLMTRTSCECLERLWTSWAVLCGRKLRDIAIVLALLGLQIKAQEEGVFGPPYSLTNGFNMRGSEPLLDPQKMRKPAATSRSNEGIALSDWLYTMFLFTKSDFKSIVIPTTVFGTMAAPKATVIHVCARLIWVWFNLLQFCVSNQSLSPAEDAANKPWRPIPAHRITVTTARRLRWMLLFVCILLSFYFRIATPGIALPSSYGPTTSCISIRIGSLEMPAMLLAMQRSIPVQRMCIADFRDSSGDALAGRRTLPLVYPQGSRIAITTLLILWSFFLCILWGLGILPSIIFLGLGAYVGGRFVTLRSTAADRRSYVYYNVWLCAAQILPFALSRVFLRNVCAGEVNCRGQIGTIFTIDLKVSILLRGESAK